MTSIGMTQSPPPFGEPSTVLDLGRADEVLIQGRAVVSAGPDLSVLIIRTRRGVFAVRNRCPHRELPLTSAAVRRGSIECPFHGRQYDLASGACRGRRQPPTGPLAVFRAWIEQDRLFLAVPASARSSELFSTPEQPDFEREQPGTGFTLQPLRDFVAAMHPATG
jgi:nitrite reductase (NADH) small subunit